jgi:protein ImuA
MIAQLRYHLQALEKAERSMLATGVPAIDGALGGGLAHGALHEIAAAGEAHAGAAAGFAIAIASLPAARPNEPRRRLGRHPGGDGKNIVWIAEDMALAESGAAYGPGLDAFGLAPERLLTVTAANQRDLLWAMEEALRCRAVRAVIGELRHATIDMVAVRRLSLAAGQSGTLALLLRASPPHDASTAATRWIAGAAPHDAFAVALTRNRRGPLGAWTLQRSNDDECFVSATPAQPLAAPATDRPRRQIA